MPRVTSCNMMLRPCDGEDSDGDEDGDDDGDRMLIIT